MSFTAKDVAALREKTAGGMMDCKKALTEANGDQVRLSSFSARRDLPLQAKKAGRIAADGMVSVYIDKEKKVGVIIEVNSETDFVAKNAEFQELVNGAAKAVADYNPADVDALLKCKFGDTEFTVEDILREKILKIGENMKIRRFERLEGDLVSYVHGGGQRCLYCQVRDRQRRQCGVSGTGQEYLYAGCCNDSRVSLSRRYCG